MRTSDKKTQGFACAKTITGQLLAHKSIVGKILIKGSNYVIPIDPGKFPVKIGFRTVRLRPSNHIQPMLCPPFAKMGRIQQLVDQFQKGLVLGG